MNKFKIVFCLSTLFFNLTAQVKLHQVPIGNGFTPYFSIGYEEYTPLVFGTNGIWSIEDYDSWLNIWNPTSGTNYIFNISPNGRVGIGAKATDNQNYIFQVYGAMWSSTIYADWLNVGGTWIWSDERLKSNVEPLTNSLQKLCKLEGNRYSKSNQLNGSATTQKKSSVLSPSTKTKLDNTKKVTSKNDVLMDDVFATERQSQEFGFMAQDVQRIFPELVKKDENSDMLSINYIGLIPVIIEALKDQNAIINEQKEQIQKLEELVKSTQENNMDSKSDAFNLEPNLDENSSDNEETPVLKQNSPNPFTNSTKISYVVPNNSGNAAIYIYDLNGVQKEVYPITNKGANEITIDKGTLSPGIYLYALIIDGKEIDIKRMILTR